MKQITNKEYEEWQKYKRRKRKVRFTLLPLHHNPKPCLKRRGFNIDEKPIRREAYRNNKAKSSETRDKTEDERENENERSPLRPANETRRRLTNMNNSDG